MTIKTSGQLNFAEISTEFGGSTPFYLSKYYRGGSLVQNGPTQNKNIPLSGAIMFSNFYGAKKKWESGPITLSAQGTTNYTMPTNTPTFLVKHNGGWGQSQEDGQILFVNSAGVVIVRLLEGATIVVPTGKAVYQVSTTGVETLLTVFPNQSSSNHNVYVEVQNIPEAAIVRTIGHSANQDNPTSFKTMNITDGFDRSVILATLPTADKYYVVK